MFVFLSTKPVAKGEGAESGKTREKTFYSLSFS